MRRALGRSSGRGSAARPGPRELRPPGRHGRLPGRSWSEAGAGADARTALLTLAEALRPVQQSRVLVGAGQRGRLSGRRARGAGERPEPPAGGRSAACGPGTARDSAVSSMWWTLQARAAGVLARSGASRSAFRELGRVVLVGCAREAAWRSGPPRRLVPRGDPSSRGAPSPDGVSVLCSWGRGHVLVEAHRVWFLSTRLKLGDLQVPPPSFF